MKKILCILLLIMTTIPIVAQHKKVPRFFSLKPHSPPRKTDYDQYGVAFRLGGGFGGCNNYNTACLFGGMHWHFKFIGLDYTGYIGNKKAFDPVYHQSYKSCAILGRSAFLGTGYYGRFLSVFVGAGIGQTNSGYTKYVMDDYNPPFITTSYSGITFDYTLKISAHGKGFGLFLQGFSVNASDRWHSYAVVGGIEFGLMRTRKLD